MSKRLIAASLFLALSALGALAQTVASTTNSSAVIATGNTFQAVLTAVTQTNQRRSLTIENNNATDNCWISFGTLANGTRITAGNATKANSILLIPGGSLTRYYPYVPNDEIEATCATSSDTLYIDFQ